MLMMTWIRCMNEINSDDVDIVEVTTPRMASTIATSTCTVNYNIYNNIWDGHNMATMMAALQTVCNTSCDINFDGTAII